MFHCSFYIYEKYGNVPKLNFYYATINVARNHFCDLLKQGPKLKDDSYFRKAMYL